MNISKKLEVRTENLGVLTPLCACLPVRHAPLPEGELKRGGFASLLLTFHFSLLTFCLLEALC